MSRIGKAIITIPAGVKVNVNGQNIKVEGPKGKLETNVHELISIKLDGDKLSFTRPNDEKFTRAMHGTTRALVNNMVEGVTAEGQGPEPRSRFLSSGHFQGSGRR